MTIESDLRDYSQRGRGRGARHILQAARESSLEEDYVSRTPTRPRRSGTIALVASIAIVAAIAAGTIAARSDSPTGPDITQDVASPSQAPTTGNVDSNPLDPTEMSPAQIEAAIAQMTPDQREMFYQLRDDLAADRMPVVSPFEPFFTGYITKEAHFDMELPETIDDLYPIVNESGDLIAYWGGQIGVISIEDVVSTDQPDFIALRDSRRPAA